MKKLLELSIVTWLLIFFIYFILYIFYFNNICNNIKKDNKDNFILTIAQISTCKSSLVCDVSDIKINNQNIITDWKCNKKINNFLEINNYFNYSSQLYFKVLNKFTKND